MTKEELIKEIKKLKYHNASRKSWIDRELVLDLVNQLDEPQKPVVPQFVANYISYNKGWNQTLHSALINTSEEVLAWFCEDKLKRQDIFARAWLDGYTIEEEKRYRVKMKNAYYNKYPQFLCETDNGIFWAAEIDLRKTKFTRRELEQDNFGWVFDCEGVEIEEVTE